MIIIIQKGNDDPIVVPTRTAQGWWKSARTELHLKGYRRNPQAGDIIAGYVILSITENTPAYLRPAYVGEAGRRLVK